MHYLCNRAASTMHDGVMHTHYTSQILILRFAVLPFAIECIFTFWLTTTTITTTTSFISVFVSRYIRSGTFSGCKNATEHWCRFAIKIIQTKLLCVDDDDATRHDNRFYTSCKLSEVETRLETTSQFILNTKKWCSFFVLFLFFPRRHCHKIEKVIRD